MLRKRQLVIIRLQSVVEITLETLRWAFLRIVWIFGIPTRVCIYIRIYISQQKAYWWGGGLADGRCRARERFRFLGAGDFLE